MNCALPTPPPGQQTLPGMADILGYVTISLDTDDEKFVWERLNHDGNGTQAYLALHPELIEQYPDEKKRRKIANDRAARIAVKRGVAEREAQVKEIIGREWLVKLKNHHGRALDFDPLFFFKLCGSEMVARRVDEIPEELRRLCTVETRVVDKRLVMVLVPPDKFRSAAELAKIMGAYAAEKKELTGADGGSLSIVSEIVFVDPPAHADHDHQPNPTRTSTCSSPVEIPTWDEEEDPDEQ
jgi:hypothetical protein